MTRSQWKVKPFNKLKNKKKILVVSRSNIISKNLVGKIVKIHNGKRQIFLKIFPDHIGYKFGEFAMTRKLAVHKGKKLHR